MTRPLTVDELWRLAVREAKLGHHRIEWARQRYRELLDQHGLLRHEGHRTKAGAGVVSIIPSNEVIRRRR